MTISPETRTELRRLHATMVNLHAAFLATKDSEIGLAAVPAANIFREAAACVSILLLDALDEAEQERDRHEAQLKLTQELLARARETIKRMEGEAGKAPAASNKNHLKWVRSELTALCEATEDDKELTRLASSDNAGNPGAFARGRIYEAKGIRRAMNTVICARLKEQ